MNILLPFGAAAVLLMIATLELVRKRRLRERYAAIWIGFAAVMLGGLIFPDGVARISHRLGFQAPAILVISTGILALALVVIQLTVDLTRLRDKAETLTSRLAIIELELRRGAAGDGDLSRDDS